MVWFADDHWLIAKSSYLAGQPPPGRQTTIALNLRREGREL